MTEIMNRKKSYFLDFLLFVSVIKNLLREKIIFFAPFKILILLTLGLGCVGWPHQLLHPSYALAPPVT